MNIHDILQLSASEQYIAGARTETGERVYYITYDIYLAPIDNHRDRTFYCNSDSLGRCATIISGASNELGNHFIALIQKRLERTGH